MACVSLIIPVYNTGRYLKKCLDSCLKQTLKDIEIIVINDGSPDNSDDIIKNYKDKRIKYIKKENEGIGKTRNLGIEEATGEFIAFVDSDDYIDKDFCKSLYDKAIKDDCDLVICDFYKDNDGSLQEIRFKDFGNTNLEDTPELINNINLGPCNKLYKRDLFKNKKNRFVEDLKYEDAPFVVNMLLSSKRIGKVNEFLTYYVIHGNSETTIRDKRIFDILKITDLVVESLKDVNYNKACITNLAVLILADYTIQQRYIKSKKDRDKFIDEAFDYLDKLDKRWRKCGYLKDNFNIKGRIIKTSRLLTKLYCDVYRMMV